MNQLRQLAVKRVKPTTWKKIPINSNLHNCITSGTFSQQVYGRTCWKQRTCANAYRALNGSEYAVEHNQKG
ncbi:hypothetical protein COLINT_03037 [Collinsella intestinalis DSM 13280]|uniref:Uncharacterized protein n=1 Tax=Collinsella intestinalis DSM 13280 TaxID=521003 RepID=C4FAE5_9ACTN|nr:hypothetical protein COLINT_03037 [Collinsella intestinalis DSM 13280]